MSDDTARLGPADLARRPFLVAAWEAVARRRGAAGPDGETVEGFARRLEAHLAALEGEVGGGGYQPLPAKRLWLAKEGTGERGVVIPCVRDRVAQGAMRRALEARVGPGLSPSAFAYRPGLGSLRAAHALIAHRDAGRVWVVRADIATFFDSVPHAGVLAALEPHLEPAAVELFGRVLRAPIRDGAATHVPEVGLAQGGVASPLLANLYLDAFDRAVAVPGAGLVRYADDFAVACGSARAAGEAYERAGAALGGLGLRLNLTKSRIVSFEQGFDFLGFRFQGPGVRVDPARIEEFKAHVEHLLNPRFGAPLAGAVREANDLIKGWRAYFQLGEVRLDFEALDGWLADRFGSRADGLERLSADRPRPRGPSLGGYEGRRPSRVERTARVAPAVPAARPPAAPRPAHPDLAREADGRPTAVRRGGRLVPLAELAPLNPPAGLIAALERAGTYHRSSLAAMWGGPLGERGAVAGAAALAGRGPDGAARAAYDAALFARAAGPEPGDLRVARGQLRRLWRLEAWCALLEIGLEAGLEPGAAGPPRLAVALADALEAPVADYALVRAASAGEVRRPGPTFAAVLGCAVPYGGVRRPWHEVVRLEAAAVARSIAAGSPHAPWLWGV